MASEHRAPAALAVAFIASVAAFPFLPAEIPPRAGTNGVYIGAPFVAFLLPLTGLALWWIAGTIDGPLHGGFDARRARELTILFVSAFHLVMLAGLIGSPVVAARVLGLVVGAFLVVTGNELPRVRLNRRLHRRAGFVRVAMGTAICLTAVAVPSWLPALIVLAAGGEACCRQPA